MSAEVLTALAEVATTAGSVLVGSVLVAGGLTKLRDFAGAWVAILEYRILPTRLARPAAAVQIIAELVVGFGLMVGMSLAAPLAVLLLACFSVAATSALARGLDIDCHCGGAGEKLSIQTLGRNALLTLMLLASLASSPDGAPLALRHLQLDIAGAVAAGLFAAAAVVIAAVSRIWVSRKDFAGVRRQVID